MNNFYADSSERVHTLLPDIIPLSFPSLLVLGEEMTGARERGKGGEARKGEVMKRERIG